MKKTYRLKLQLDGDDKQRVYRTDGVPTYCCSLSLSYFIWEKNTKFNDYQGWSGYISEGSLRHGLDNYNPDKLAI
jgi:hypothetical protein